MLKVLSNKLFLWRKKKTWRSSQDLNLGPLNSGQMLLPTEPLELCMHGIGAEDRLHLSIDTVRFSSWISHRLGELCTISTEVLLLSPANWLIAAATLYVPSEPPFVGADRKHFSFSRKAIQSAYASLTL